MSEPRSWTPLSAIEARALGVLAEKQLTTPDYYPLTMNALVAGCNQKSSRDPVMNVTERELQPVIDDLRGRTLIIESYGASGRVLRYAHNVPKVLNIGQSMLALLTSLMLRGPQTAGELRTNCDRMYHFADTSAVEAYLEDMTVRAATPLVVKLPKQPGSREHRWAHLLCGEVEIANVAREMPAQSTSSNLDELREEIGQLREELALLRARVESLEAGSS